MANDASGPRIVPAKSIPVPTDLDPQMTAAVAAPYSRLWNLSAPSDAAWRTVVAQGDAALTTTLDQLQSALDVTVEPTVIGGVKAFMVRPRIVPANHRGQLVVHLHGGGFVFGHGKAGTQEAMMIAALGGYDVLSVDYRMPPDAPYPAGLDDAAAVWAALVKTTDPRRVALQGTSAGGNIALALLQRIRAEKLPMPGAVALNSPAADLTGTGDSFRVNEWVDNVVVSGDAPYLSQVTRLYSGSKDTRNPGLSPLFGDMHGLPPTILTTGTRDLLLSDAVRVHRKLRRAGVEASLQVYEALSHSQQLFAPTSSTTTEIYREIAAFFDGHLAR